MARDIIVPEENYDAVESTFTFTPTPLIDGVWPPSPPASEFKVHGVPKVDTYCFPMQFKT
jgi:hypothetical protein